MKFTKLIWLSLVIFITQAIMPVNLTSAESNYVLNEDDVKVFAEKIDSGSLSSTYDVNEDGLLNESDVTSLKDKIDFYDAFLSRNDQIDSEDIGVYSDMITQFSSETLANILGNGEFDWDGNGNEAYRIMRELSLGITNEDIRKIDVGDFEIE